MSHISKRFSLYFALFILSLVPFALSPVGGVQLALAIALGAGVLSGSAMSRAFMLAFVCVSGAASLLAVFAGGLSVFGSGDTLTKMLLLTHATGSFLLCIGMASCLIDERFKRWMNAKRYARSVSNKPAQTTATIPAPST